ncbi:hypothetical protein ACHQM5_027492 [Ranunculus cassubicifolius]
MALSLSRITRRPFQLSDDDDFKVCATDDLVIRFIRPKNFTTAEEALSYLNDVAIPTLEADQYRRHRVCFGSSVLGQGIGTCAVKLAISSVFRDFPCMVQLQGLVDVENKASHRVLEKAGFHREGVLRKYMVFKGKTRDFVIFSFFGTDPIIR